MSAVTATAPKLRRAARVPPDHVIVLFGATGDLAKRKLLPGMFHLARVGLMPERFRVIGVARHTLDAEEFREFARDAVDASERRSLDPQTWERFAESLSFVGVGDGFEARGAGVEAAPREHAAHTPHHI
jgi:glucose-6-phosphate 1-dehydrogenase